MNVRQKPGARRKSLLTGIGWLCFLPCAQGDEFSWEVAGLADRVAIGDAVKIDGFAVRAIYHFRPVDDTRGPYAVAPFLNRSPRLSVSTTRSDERSEYTVSSPFSSPILQSSTLETTGYALAGRYVWGETGWYVGGAADRSDTDWPTSETSSTDSELNGYTFLGGKYFGDTTALELTYRSTTLTLDVMQAGQPGALPFPLPAISGRNETETEDFGVSAFHVGNLGRIQYSVSGQLHSSQAKFKAFGFSSAPPPDPQPVPGPGLPIVSVPTNVSPRANPLVVTRDRIHSYSVAAEFFPTPALGVRAGYSGWDDDPSQDRSYALAANWFFKRAIAARVSFTRTTRDVGVPGLADLDDVAVEVSGRF